MLYACSVTSFSKRDTGLSRLGIRNVADKVVDTVKSISSQLHPRGDVPLRDAKQCGLSLRFLMNRIITC